MRPALSVLEAHLVNYRRTWRGTTLGSFVLPVLFMVGFGIGVGHFVDAGGRLGQVRYLDYIVPGQVAVGALNLGFFESAWPVLSRFQWIRTYHAMAAAPLRIADIIGGGLLYILFRLLATSGVFLAVAAVFGAVHSPWVLVAPLVCALLGLATAALVHGFSSRVDNDSYFMLLIRFLLIPVALFSGVYFPISALPGVLHALAYASPVWHATELCRAVTLGHAHLSGLVVLGHVAYLAGLGALGFWLALRGFRRRLVV